MTTPSRSLLLAALLAAAGAAASAPAARGQEAPGEEAGAGGGFHGLEGNAPYSTAKLQDGELVVTVVGSPDLSRESFSVEAEGLVLWFAPPSIDAGKREELLGRLLPGEEGREGPPPGEAPPPPARPAPFAGEQPLGPLAGARALPDSLKEYLGPVLHALYAEGEVVFRLGTGNIRCERLYVDFRRNLLLTGKVQMTVGVGNVAKGRSLPLVLRAERMRRDAAGSLVLEDASFGTCDFGEPHWRFQSSEIRITGEEDHVSFTAYHNVPKLGEVPLFYFPVLGGRSDLSARPLRSASYRSSGRFGQEVDLLWADDIAWRGSRWGEWRLRTDVKSDRGPGVGPELQYDYGDYEGELRTYWQKDNADTDDFDGSPVPRDDRGRVRWEHRQKLSAKWTLDLSLFDFSDRNYQQEYEKEEAQEDRDPETYATLRFRDGTDWAALTVKPRLDSFRTETTELPDGTFRRIGAEGPGGGTLWGMLDAVTWSADARAGAYEREFDEDLGRRGDRELRQDAVGRMEGVKWLGPVSVAPFVLAGGTLWQGLEATPGEDGDRARGDLAAGVRAAVEARREFPGAESGFFDFRGLRHLSMVEALAYDRFAVTQDPLGPGAVDRTDDLAELKAFALRFRNRLQAERGGRRVDWIDLEVRAHWFPGGLDPAASPLRFKEEGLEEARFSDFRGEEKYRGSPLRGEWGPYEGDLRVWARENLYLLGEAEYDPYEGVTRTSAVGARWFVIPKASLYAGNRRIAGDSNIYTLAADWAVSEKWLLHLSQQTDFRRDEGLRTEFGFRRVWHDFVLEFDVEYDGLQDDFSLRFSLVPSFLWESPTARKDLPKLDYEARRWYR